MSEPYNYLFNSEKGIYHFDTDSEVDFTVYFALDSSWFPYNPELSDHIYTFGFNTSTGSFPPDIRIKNTIAAIIKERFSFSTESVLTFICDDDDGKQLFRQRKFDSWFSLMNSGNYCKINKDVIFEGKTLHTSIIMHVSNSRFDQIKNLYTLADKDVTSKILD